MKSIPTFMETTNKQLSSTMDTSYPPFHETYKTLIDKAIQEYQTNPKSKIKTLNIVQCELPLIDLSPITLSKGHHDHQNPNSKSSKEQEMMLEKCKEDIGRASQEWGFFQVVNHGISRGVLDKMRGEQVKVFKQPFDRKCGKEDKFLNFSAGTYRWGTPTATCLSHLSWSEAFHIPMSDISMSSPNNIGNGFTDLSSTMEEFATRVAKLAQNLAEILAEKLGAKSSYFKENCLPTGCYLRLNRYPPCPLPINNNNIPNYLEVYGLMPHTDSDFLTILYQDNVGGLQLVKDGQWFAVKPNPDALIINIGDLFQAWSNDVYKSVEHRVVRNPRVERFSTAYFFCPSYDAEITTTTTTNKPSVYKNFSFRQYRQQVQDDVQKFGCKIGLPRFLAL